jgi:hypothetical protein
MNELDRMYLEQNIQASIAQGELDIEDAIAIRQLRDIDQAERLLIVRRKKRMKMRQEMAQQNSQFQAQANAQVAQVTSQSKMQEEQMKAQLDAQKIQLEGQVKAQMLQVEYGLRWSLLSFKETTESKSSRLNLVYARVLIKRLRTARTTALRSKQLHKAN